MENGGLMHQIFRSQPFLQKALPPTKFVELDKGTVWEVPHYFDFIKKVGSGSYGIVASFEDRLAQRKVAVKKIGDVFKEVLDARRILREIRILKYFQHDNIIKILDIFPPRSPDFHDVYLVSELMQTNLNQIIHSNQDLTEGHFQYFIYQILRGLLYLHSADVLHRDLKPCNILINLDCMLKICDFGLARGLAKDDPPNRNQQKNFPSKKAGILQVSSKDKALYTASYTAREQELRNSRDSDHYARARRIAQSRNLSNEAMQDQQGSEDIHSENTDIAPDVMTDYVVTRWYRSPEIILNPHHYEKPIDIWSLGCIFGELLGRRILFKGESHIDQLNKIVSIVGTPTLEDISWLPSRGINKMALRHLLSHSTKEGISMQELLPNANACSLDLLEKMLIFNPEERITVEEALEHEYFEGLHSPDTEPRCEAPMDWRFDNFRLTKSNVRVRMYLEMACYNPVILPMAQELSSDLNAKGSPELLYDAKRSLPLSEACRGNHASIGSLSDAQSQEIISNSIKPGNSSRILQEQPDGVRWENSQENRPQPTARDDWHNLIAAATENAGLKMGGGNLSAFRQVDK